MGFESFHPAVNLLYFVAVMSATACFHHPVYLAISFACALVCCGKCCGRRGLRFGLCMIPLALGIAFWYASYHHFGVTLLWNNTIGNRVTLESLAYGISLGVTVAALLMWMACVHAVFSADKVIYLFGRISPRLSLFLSIVLRMVPRLKAQARRIVTAQRAIGRGPGQGNLLRRLRNTMRIGSILLTWLPESFVTSAESMRSRGYTLRGRTAFSIYRFDNRDRVFVVGMFACLTLMMMAAMLHQTEILYDPRIVMNPITPLSVVFYVGYGAFCLAPPVLQTVGEVRFRRLRRGLPVESL